MISVVISARNAARPLAATLAALDPAGRRRHRPAGHRCRRRLIRQHGEGRRSRWRRHRRERSGIAALNWLTARRGHAFPGFYFSMPERFSKTAGSEAPRLSCDESIAASGRWPPAPSRCGSTIREWPRGCIERLVHLRCKIWRMPYGDQGLLIPRQLFDAVGGYKNLPMMEDIDLARRLGRQSPRHARCDRRDIGRTLQARRLSTALDAQSDVPGALSAPGFR